MKQEPGKNGRPFHIMQALFEHFIEVKALSIIQELQCHYSQKLFCLYCRENKTNQDA